MIKYISIFWLVLRCLLVARKENSTGFSTGLTGRSKNLDPTGNPTGAGWPDQFPSLLRIPAVQRTQIGSGWQVVADLHFKNSAINENYFAHRNSAHLSLVKLLANDIFPKPNYFSKFMLK